MVTWGPEKQTRQKYSIVSAVDWELIWLTHFPGIPSPNAKHEHEYLLGMGKRYTSVLLSITPRLVGTRHLRAPLYLYVHTYKETYANIYTYTYILTHRYMCIYLNNTYKYTDVEFYIYIYVCVCMHKYIFDFSKFGFAPALPVL